MLNTFATNIIPDNDEERLRVLRYYYHSSLFADESLQNQVELIAAGFDVPLAAISLVDKKEILFVSSLGFGEMKRIGRGISLCSLTVLTDEITEFPNTKAEPLLFNNPLVQGENGIVFYAAAPLITKEGIRIGSVCIAGREERTLSPGERNQLRRFARSIMHDLELRATLQRKAAGLEERELQLKQAYKMARIGSWEFDAETRVAHWSDELFDMYGVDKDSCTNDLFAEYLSLVHPDDLEEAIDKSINAEEAPLVRHERLVRPDGKLIWLNQFKKNSYDADGNLQKIFGVSQDVTERVAYEVRLKKHEDRFRALVQNSSDMLAVLDPAATITYVSPGCFAISGFTPEELMGCNVFAFLHEADMAEVKAEFLEVANSINSGEPTLHRFRTKNGDWVWLESKGTNLLHDPNVGGLVINARNVTERIRLEEQLAVEQQSHQREITSAVIRAQENERAELGRELHDNINQVLTTIKLYMEMMGDNVAGNKQLVGKAGQLLQNCIEEIRRISKRLTVPALGEIGLEESIRELIASINLTNRIDIAYTGHGVAQLHISKDVHLAVYRIVQEQLNNIIKYASSSLVLIKLKKQNGVLSLQIIDNGKGFDPFVRRSGIGITNMQTRTENLNGKFRLTSSPGNGCQLLAQFPLSCSGESSEEKLA